MLLRSGTTRHAIHFKSRCRGPKTPLIQLYPFNYYSDSDFGADIVSRRSVTGLMVHANGAPVFWKSVLQKTVSLSTAEAELVALSSLAQSAQFFKRLLAELGYETTPVLRCDNQATISLVSSDQQFHERTKHICIKFFYARDLVESGEMKVEFIQSSRNLADLATKPHNPSVLQNLLTLVGIKPITSVQEC